MSQLKTLDRQSRALVTDAFLTGDVKIDFERHARDYPRVVPLEPLAAVLTRARQEIEDPVAADRWLAPRVHAALRLTRREAADRNMWAYLALVPFEEYARWRFSNAPAERFIGAENNHALGRLWWGAELLRNGSDYENVVTAFRIQDIPNTGFRFDAFHHRPLALAAVRVLGTWRNGEPATGREANKLLKALNLELVTLALDADIPDTVAHGDPTWIASAPEVDALLEEALPVGPADAAVSPPDLNRAVELVRSVAQDINL